MTGEQLEDYLRKNLASYKIPRLWISVEAFPLTGSGKIQKYVLREQWLNGELGIL